MERWRGGEVERWRGESRRCRWVSVEDEEGEKATRIRERILMIDWVPIAEDVISPTQIPRRFSSMQTTTRCRTPV